MKKKILILLLAIMAVHVTIDAGNEVVNAGYTIRVSDNVKQKIRLGVDAERLWYWRSPLKDKLAQLAVGEMKSEYVRVAIACDYEREKGVINPAAYDMILEMMAAMKRANPDILFFASPRPLQEAYSKEEAIAEWGSADNIPWSAYPRWILQWNQNGTKTLSDGIIVPKWVQGDFDVPALAQYYADYLNFMYSKGFLIDYLDATNEKAVISPEINKYLYDNIPTKLNPGVQMPKMIVPSSWSVQGGIDWLDTLRVDRDEHLAFEIAAVHNTGDSGSPAVFAAAAHGLGKEPWNTELHNWIGTTLQEEVMTSEVFWQYMRAGFVGIETWLFFGPAAGKPHSMIWANNSTAIKSGKYEIFKQVVNNANGGNYVDVSLPSSAFVTSAFVKDSILSVWVLNKQSSTAAETAIQILGDRNILGRPIELTRWRGSETLNSGETSTITATEPDRFYCDLTGESLYFFKINTGGTTSVDLVSANTPHLRVVRNAVNEILIHVIHVESAVPGKYTITDLQGRTVRSGLLEDNQIRVDVTGISRGIYLVSTQTGHDRLVEKLFLN